MSRYEKLDHREHVLRRVDSYLGSDEPEKATLWLPTTKDNGSVVMEQEEITYVPAFYKIFDEILVNAADNKTRDPTMDTIKVEIDVEDSTISVWNNGKGIPVKMHEKEPCYVPELIFGHLLTGSNFEDDEKRTTGGRNGYGAKLTNIFSKEFTIETHDSENQKTYRQTWTENMTRMSKPRITTARKSDYTKVTFVPDLAKFNMTAIDGAIERLLRRRVYDLAGSVRGVKVYVNGQRIKINGFKDYVGMYLRNVDNEKPKIVYDRPNDRWEVAFALSDSGTFQQVSFVNSMCTTKGGTHVNHVVDQIVLQLSEIVKKKVKNVKPAQIKNQMFVFVNCAIENPKFDSQSKDNMTLRVGEFGSSCPISESFVNRIVKTGIVDLTLSAIKEKETSQLHKTDGQKRSRLSGIVKLDDANCAGTKRSKDCVLLLTEGDSAKAFAISGLSSIKNGRDTFGAFPLRGKLLNVRDASPAQKMQNQEILQLKKILGLEEKKAREYTSTDSLRYGRICCLTDSDLDGCHIKALILNWLAHDYPSLARIPGFITEFTTPMVKCNKGKQEKLFYSQQEYNEWKRANGYGKGWTIKYYKGLGTNTKDDAKRYFGDVARHLKRFRALDDTDAEKLDMVFSKKRANDRKEWLKMYDPEVHMDSTADEYSVQEFIDKSLIQFSMYDNIRSIPSVVDGLKPGQRKILYVALKRNLKQDLKVAQLAGAVSETTEYRHGEQSLCETIVGMAQDFCGSNNLNLLYPSGQFGTRLQGGKDAASPRYIYTRLSDVTRRIFCEADDPILEHLSEDGVYIEPKWYVPVIPMVLVNGAEGIGSGYSTTVLAYDPRRVIENLQSKLRGDHFFEMTPWYRNFKGTTECADGKCTFAGIANRKNASTVEIVELPVGKWTQTYKEHLEKMIESGTVKDYKEYHTEDSVKFVVNCPKLSDVPDDQLLSVFGLTTVKHTTNMMLFDPRGYIKKYDSVTDILEDHYDVRLEWYRRRKVHVLDTLKQQAKVLENKRRFLTAIFDGTLVVYKRSKVDVQKDLSAQKFAKVNGTFDYLLIMPLHTLTEEKLQELDENIATTTRKIVETEAKKEQDMWLDDLERLVEIL